MKSDIRYLNCKSFEIAIEKSKNGEKSIRPSKFMTSTYVLNFSTKIGIYPILSMLNPILI